jgi:hypothetical protein
LLGIVLAERPFDQNIFQDEGEVLPQAEDGDQFHAGQLKRAALGVLDARVECLWNVVAAIRVYG